MRGDIQLVSGERRDRGRSEAEYRASKPVVKCAAGESFDAFERRMFNRALDMEWAPAKRELIRVVEDLGLSDPSAAIKSLMGSLSDFEGDFINVDPRKEE